MESHALDVPRGVLEDIDPAEYPADLPPFGSIGEDESTHGQALAYLMRIGDVAEKARRDRIIQAEANAKIYEWGQETQPCSTDVVANEIQTQVLSISALQTQEPFLVLIRPVQTRDKSPMFWIGPPVDAQVALLTGLPVGLGLEPVIDPMTGAPAIEKAPPDPQTGLPLVDQMGQPALQPMMQPATTFTPLDEITAWQIKKLAATGAFPSEWFVTLDDRLVADVYQTVFDVYWQDGHLDDFVFENVLKTNIFGYQTSSYSWDVRNKKHLVRDISIKQAFLDPQAEGSNFDLQNCPGYEIVMDLDQAKAEWPQLAELIQEKATTGQPDRVDGNSDFGVASDRDFQQRTVTFRIHWFRNQQMPMTEEEAVATGEVVGDGMGSYYLANAEPVSADLGTGAGEGSLGGAEPRDNSNPAGPTVQSSDDAGLDGMGASGDMGRDEGGLHTSTDTQAPAQTAPVWPQTLGIRQIATIAQTGRIVQDIRCEYWDIPMLLNVCIPLPSQPFGQGLPEKLRGLQQADNRLLQSNVDYVDHLSKPGCIMPKSVADQIPTKKLFVDVSKAYVAPDELIQRWGDKAIIWFTPPPLPPAVPQTMQLIQDRLQSSSGHPEVMSGTPPSPTSSGKMVEALQSAVVGQFGFQAQWTAKMVQRLANHMHYSHLWRLELEDIKGIYSRLPDEILAMVIDRGQRGRWDIQVEANSTASGHRNKKLAQALAMFTARSATGEPVMPLRMVREEANLDSEECSIAFREEMQNAVPTAPPDQQQPGQEPAPDQRSPEGSMNGNGHSNGNGRFSGE